VKFDNFFDFVSVTGKIGERLLLATQAVIGVGDRERSEGVEVVMHPTSIILSC
jgi:hypothetical protein